MTYLGELDASLLRADMTEVRDHAAHTQMQQTVANNMPAPGAHCAAVHDEYKVGDYHAQQSHLPAAATEIHDECDFEKSREAAVEKERLAAQRIEERPFCNGFQLVQVDTGARRQAECGIVEGTRGARRHTHVPCLRAFS